MTLAHKFGKLDVRVTDDFANKESETEIVSDVTCVLKIVTRAVTTVISASLWTTTVEGANTEGFEMTLCQKTFSSCFGEQGRDNSFFSCFYGFNKII